MDIYQLPVEGTLIIVQGGLALLAVAFGVKYAIKCFVARKHGK